MQSIRRTSGLLVSCVVAFGLTACASGPEFDASGYDRNVTPEQASSDPATHDQREVLWGGLIVSVSNLEDRTEIEILAYPLTGGSAPDDAKAPTGRFIARSDDFVEPLEFEAGREVTVVGQIVDSIDGKVGDARYRYPVVAADDLYLWEPRRNRGRPEVGFGFGFIFGS